MEKALPVEGFSKYVGSLDIYAIEQLVSHGVDLTLKNRFDAPATNRFYSEAMLSLNTPSAPYSHFQSENLGW